MGDRTRKSETKLGNNKLIRETRIQNESNNRKDRGKTKENAT